MTAPVVFACTHVRDQVAAFRAGTGPARVWTHVVERPQGWGVAEGPDGRTPVAVHQLVVCSECFGGVLPPRDLVVMHWLAAAWNQGEAPPVPVRAPGGAQ